MLLELTISELGEALKKIEEKHKLNVLIKSNLTGGWMTITGEADIDKIPNHDKHGCSGREDNIIHIKVKTESDEDGIIMKLTGAKDKKFNVDISSSKYRELRSNNLSINQVKVNENESKLRIDENMIFTIKAPADDVIKLIES